MSQVKKPKKKINSRQKGAAAERELANELRDRYGYTARRGQQFKGGADSPDVVCDQLSRYHLECKRTEKGNLYDWMAQAKRDCGGKTPVVVHRRNNKDWVAILTLRDFVLLTSEW